MTSLLYMKHL